MYNLIIAAATDFGTVTKPVMDLLEAIFTAAIPLVGAIGAIYCIFLGVKYAKAEEQQEREKAKHSLKNSIVGFILIFVLVVVLRLALPLLTNWMGAQVVVPS
ncbi:MAG: pilin [Defluviitaleaceae bacterium]|nr:pilin [Defluviitaleaceae bacterium]